MLAFLKRNVRSLLKSVGFEKIFDPFLIQRSILTTLRSSNATIFDVGAHIGSVSLKYAQLFPTAKIYSFEPFPESFSILNERIKNDSHISTYNLALLSSPRRSQLYSNVSSATNSVHKSDPAAAFYWGEGIYETKDCIEVEGTSLDVFCCEHAINHIDILKIDVQGSEFEVLTGAQGMLFNHQIDLIYMEVIFVPTYENQKSLADYIQILYPNDYILFDFYNPIRKGYHQLIQADLIFAYKDTVTKFWEMDSLV